MDNKYTRLTRMYLRKSTKVSLVVLVFEESEPLRALTPARDDGDDGARRVWLEGSWVGGLGPNETPQQGRRWSLQVELSSHHYPQPPLRDTMHTTTATPAEPENSTK